jgi:hypothetical protein
VVVASIRSIRLDTALIWPKPRRSTAITLVAAQGLDLIHPQFRTGAHPCTSIKAGPEPHRRTASLTAPTSTIVTGGIVCVMNLCF